MKFLHPIDNFLNKFTMYKVILYTLMILSTLGIVFAFMGRFSYNSFSLFLSLLILVFISFGVNILLSRIYKAPANIESSLITGFILFLILQPLHDFNSAIILLLAAIIAMGSKYILTLNKKHIFNPAALAAVVLGISLNYGAVWWVASPVFLPFTIILGFLIVRKIRRFVMFFSFLIPALLTLVFLDFSNGIPLGQSIAQSFTAWPVVFFGTVMFTEPRTMPPTQKNQIIFGLLVGLLFVLPFRLGPLSSTPELALLIGNVFAFITGSRRNYLLKFSEKIKLAPNLYDFNFMPEHKPNFLPGQYLEWTLPHKRPDSRGNRRFFTIASSPTEKDIKIGVKIVEKSSSFKKSLLAKNKDEIIAAGELSGDFTLPKDEKEKLVFIAGGIGITPFRSMIKYIIDTKQKRDIVLFYAVSDPAEFVYKDIFEKASYSNLLKIFYVITHPENSPANWNGETGRLTDAMIKEKVTDYDKRLFYLSGPNAMVQGYKEILENLGVKRSKIITDYFPGY